MQGKSRADKELGRGREEEENHTPASRAELRSLQVVEGTKAKTLEAATLCERG